MNAAQKPGPRPLGNSSGAPLPPLSVNDDRMQQVEYLDGQVFSTLNTGIGARNKADRSGVAWFVVTPGKNGGGVMAHQGYVAATGGTTLLYPSIGMDSDGLGVMTFSVSGPTYYPSAAYALMTRSAVSSPIFRNGQVPLRKTDSPATPPKASGRRAGGVTIQPPARTVVTTS